MRPERWLIVLLTAWYFLLILAHYFGQRPLWNDEQCVLDSIIQLTPTQLFSRPLLSDQAFPRLYLWLIQQFSDFFHHSLLSLRFFPFISMAAALAIWSRIARRVLGESWGLVLFMAAWCGSMPMVYYAAELKPYSMDVLACGLIVLYLLNPLSCPRKVLMPDTRKSSRASNNSYKIIFLPWLALFSYPAIFLLLLPLYDLIRQSIAQRRWLPELYGYLASYAFMLGLVYYFDFRVSAHYLLEEFWHDYFISMDSLGHFFNSFGKGINNMIGRCFAENPHWVKAPSRVFIGLGVAYMLLKFWEQFKKDQWTLRSIVPIAAMMFFLQLILALARIYPFGVPRMSLFFSPPLFLTVILAMTALQKWRKWLGLLPLAFAAYLILVSVGTAWDVFAKGSLGAESRLFG